jgi:hypothetical protein
MLKQFATYLLLEAGADVSVQPPLLLETLYFTLLLVLTMHVAPYTGAAARC